MENSRAPCYRRPLTAATVLLVGTTALGCSSRRQAETEATPVARAADNPNVLERHEMNSSATSIVELIEGRLPGVVVQRRGADISVQIRGPRSFRSNDDALILIDGLESTGRALNNVNPKDVERIEVLKDGAAALYGMRGANGVLLITTRRR